ncbi:hypothetical protein PQR05_29740 [Paraburkholderia sediminicola]|uniref:hypothetical protein n=1 Tax=Paraburkholderia sediminicola TaxID=458836 RepID=UPI0038B6D513
MKKIPVTTTAAQPSRKLGELFTKAGIVHGVETSVVLGKDADHLQVIAAIAADGLAVETTPERRLLLQGIRTAIEKTLELAQVAQ